MRFYMTFSRDAPGTVVPYAEAHDIPLMTSALTRYGANGFNDLWSYATPHAVDSGGYSALARHGDYPYSVEDYHAWLRQHKDEFEWAAVMDYACERRFDDQFSVQERIDMTVENTIQHFNLDPDYDLLPVLQGRLRFQYLETYDRLRDHGIPTDRVGLGTVCRIESSPKIVQLENEIREATDIEWMHGFGVKITAFKNGASFESADSAAWNVAPSHGKCYIDDETRLNAVSTDNTSNEDIFESFKNYYSYVRRILDRREREIGGKLLNP